MGEEKNGGGGAAFREVEPPLWASAFLIALVLPTPSLLLSQDALPPSLCACLC